MLFFGGGGWLGWSTFAVAQSLARTNINLMISRFPSSLKLFFFERRGIKLQPTLVTDLAGAERRKHCFNNLHICVRYTSAEHKKEGGNVCLSVDFSQSTQKTCCEATVVPASLRWRPEGLCWLVILFAGFFLNPWIETKVSLTAERFLMQHLFDGPP